MAYIIGLDDTLRRPVAWAKAQDGVPTDRQMLTWDTSAARYEYQWPGMTNFSENRTFTILPTGSTVATINTALTDYDVVYLEAGTYTMGGTPIAIPSGKALIGLGDSSWGGTGGVYINGSAGATGANFITMNNGYLSNVTCYAAAAQANDIIVGNTTDYANRIERVVVGAAAASNAYAFSGAFILLDQFRTYWVNGVYLKASTWQLFGWSHVHNFYIYAPTTYGVTTGVGAVNAAIYVVIENGMIDGASLANYGIHCAATVSGPERHTIRNCSIKYCSYGIYYLPTAQNYYFTVTDCTLDNCSNGIYTTRAYLSTFANCTFNANATIAGYFESSIGNTWTGLHHYNGPVGSNGFYWSTCEDGAISSCEVAGGTRGFVFISTYDTAISNCSAQSCNGAAGANNGNFYFNTISRCAVSNLASMLANNTNNSAFYITNAIDVSFTGMQDYESIYGVYLAGASIHECSFSNLQFWNPTTTGFYSDANSHLRMAVDGLYVYHAGGIGVRFYDFDNSSISNVVADANTGVGIEIILCDDTTFSNLTAISGSSVGISQPTGYGAACTFCTFTGLVARNNRGGAGCHGVYFGWLSYSVVSNVTTYDNQGSGFVIGDGIRCTFMGISATSDDACGIVVGNSLTYCVISGAAIYAVGSYGIDLNGCMYSIVTNVITDSCGGLYGQYYRMPLRSMFCNNKAVNQAGGGMYGCYFLNNGTGYNQFHGNTCSNCANLWPSGGGYGNWLYDDNYNLN